MRFLPKFLRSDKEQTRSDIIYGDKGYSERQPTADKKTECMCNVQLLDEHEFTVNLKMNVKGYTLLDAVLDHLQLVEREYFGLRFLDQTKQTHWLDVHRSLVSQLKSSPPFRFYFGVKFYSADPCKLREEVTRYQIFLQVKNDIAQGRLAVTFDEAAELAAYAVQSELGDYDPGQHTHGYTSEFRFIPNQTPEFEETVAGIHRQLIGLMPAVAEYKFLDKVKWLEMYGVDLHPVLGESQLEYFLGLTPTGIVVYKNKVKVGNYFWPRILKVTHKGKIFIVKVKDRNNDEHSYAFETGAKVACKHLWKCCLEHHAFFRANQSGETLKTGNGFFKWGSKARVSFRREQPSPKPSRPYPTQVYRMRSRRHARRASSENGYDGHSSMESVYNTEECSLTVVATLEPAEPYRHCSYPNLPHTSPQSVRSVPWETQLDGGLYTSGRDSPESVRSEKMKFPSRRGLTTSSDTELASRKKYFMRRGCSDDESDISVPRRRRRETDTSGSDSESGYRRTSHRTQYMTHTSKHASCTNGDRQPSEAAYETANQRRKRRTRSRSPNKKPPEELKKHFEYDLIDTDGMSKEQLQDIPFVNVQTKAQPFRLYYDKNRRRYRSPHRMPSSGDVGEKGITVNGLIKSAPVAASVVEPPHKSSIPPDTTYVIAQVPTLDDGPRIYERVADKSSPHMGGSTDDSRISHSYQHEADVSQVNRSDSSSKHPHISVNSPPQKIDRSYIDVPSINPHSLSHNLAQNLSVRAVDYSPEDAPVTKNLSESNSPATSTYPTNLSSAPTVTVTKLESANSLKLAQPNKPKLEDASPSCYNYKSIREAYRNTMWKRYPSQSQALTNEQRSSTVGYKQHTSYSSSAIGPNHHTPSKLMPPSAGEQGQPQRHPSSASSNCHFSPSRPPPPPGPAAPLSIQRPVYSWSHFQPVRNSPSPSQSGNLSGSFNTNSTKYRHRVAPSNTGERWTEL